MPCWCSCDPPHQSPPAQTHNVLRRDRSAVALAHDLCLRLRSVHITAHKCGGSRQKCLGAPTKSRRRVAKEEKSRRHTQWGTVWGGVFLGQLTRRFGERDELPRLGLKWAPVGNAFGRILKATERSGLNLYANTLTSSNSVSCHIWGKAKVWGQLSPASK